MIESAIKNKYDFMMVFDCFMGNPNGDPDAGGKPRIDPETGIGIVTDGCIKRKIRNYVMAKMEEKSGYGMYIKQKRALETCDRECLSFYGFDSIKDVKKGDPAIDVKFRDFMCRNFWDIRTFGAVISTFMQASLASGQVLGPVQLSMATSVDPVYPVSMAITRMAITREADVKRSEIGNRSFIPYGLYVMRGSVNAMVAQKQTGFSEDDLKILWEAIRNMFDNDQASGRGIMAMRKLIVFKHDHVLGNAHPYKLFEKVHIHKKDGVDAPRKYEDYDISIDSDMPAGVSVTEMV